jgi:diaminopimelate epimerase
VGGDGVIFLLPATGPDYDFTCVIHNADGTVPEMCGNGIRTLAQYVVDQGLAPGGPGAGGLPARMRFLTGAGLIVPTVNADRSVEVDMGFPTLAGGEVPSTLEPTRGDAVVRRSVEVGGKDYEMTCVSMGNPHGVVFFDTPEELDAAFDSGAAAALECHPSFPNNANIEFVARLSDTHLKMRVFERGAGPTLACGTGACALTVAAALAGVIPTADKGITVTLPGGDLSIRWEGEGGKVWMTGPAVKVMEGFIESDDW